MFKKDTFIPQETHNNNDNNNNNNNDNNKDKEQQTKQSMSWLLKETKTI